MNHCRDMKRQETTFRIITLLLLCCCAAFFFFTNFSDLKQHEKRVSETHLASMKQERLCPAENNESKDAPLLIHLDGDFTSSPAEDQYLAWKTDESNETYDTETRTLGIPRDGFYFISFKFLLGCPEISRGFQMFRVKLHQFLEGYDHPENLTGVKDGLDCDIIRTRTVYVGGYFKLNERDRLGLMIENGSDLIYESEFDAFQS